MRKLSGLLLICLFVISCQKRTELGATEFWDNLNKHCGKAYVGELVYPENDPDFSGKELIIDFKLCSENQLKIPFYVGDDHSRVWILTRKNNVLELDHEHRHQDGTPDKITMYGGVASNSGQSTIQVFPANQYTVDILPEASTNIWWLTLENDVLTYNLRRIGTERLFSIKFDLTKPVEAPAKPWGWK